MRSALRGPVFLTRSVARTISPAAIEREESSQEIEASRRGARGLASKEAPRRAWEPKPEPELLPLPPEESSSEEDEADALTPAPPLFPPPPFFEGGGGGSTGTLASPGIPSGNSLQATRVTTKAPGDEGVAVRTTGVEARGPSVTETEGVEQQQGVVVVVAVVVEAPPPPFLSAAAAAATATSRTPSSLRGIDIGLKKVTATETGSPTTAEKRGGEEEEEEEEEGGGGSAAAVPFPPPPPLLVSAESSPLQTPRGASRDPPPHQVTRASVREVEVEGEGEEESDSTEILSTAGTGAGGGATAPFPFAFAAEVEVVDDEEEEKLERDTTRAAASQYCRR
jgi:hypothetical protein